MRGHIVRPSAKRSNLWAVIIELPRDPITGKRKQKWHSGFRARKEAELAEKLAAADAIAVWVEPMRVRVDDGHARDPDCLEIGIRIT